MTHVRVQCIPRGRVRRTWILGVVAVAASITPVGLAGCGDDDDDELATFERDTFPFTFEYPDGFEVTDDVSASQTLGGGTSRHHRSDVTGSRGSSTGVSARCVHDRVRRAVAVKL